MNYALHTADCVEFMQSMDPCSVDSIVCDPPYELGFMGKRWDSTGVAFSPDTWRAALRVLKPGGHMLAFGGARTMHRIVCAIEDAGFEIRDTLMWVYGSGFPKSLDVSKAIDKAAGAEREVVGHNPVAAAKANKRPAGEMNARYRGSDAANDNGATITAPATDASRQWQGWGTALKPAFEPIVLARKPLIGTVAANVTAHGTGALNIDGCRVGTSDAWAQSTRSASDSIGTFKTGERTTEQHALGRWPANVMHDGSDEVLHCFPDTKGGTAIRSNSGGNTFGGSNKKPPLDDLGYGDSGSVARFFYCAKASKKDRSDGNNHPTVKPNALMRYLCRLVTPPGGIVLDPFMGSGSTGVAAMQEGFRFLGIDMDPAYTAIAYKRIEDSLK